MKRQKIKIISASSDSFLEREVQEYLDEGYRIQNTFATVAPSYTPDLGIYDSELTIFAVLVKEESDGIF